MFTEVVDALIDKMLIVGDDFALLGQEIWQGFINENGFEPEPFGSDFRISYRGVELREAAA